MSSNPDISYKIHSNESKKNFFYQELDTDVQIINTPLTKNHAQFQMVYPIFSVLFVDDDVDYLNLVKLFIEKFGNFIVETTNSGKSALELLSIKKFDAIISDYEMPEISGIDLLKQLRRSGNYIPFILFTNADNREVNIEAMDEGADFFHRKIGEPKTVYSDLADKVKFAIIKKQTENQVKDLRRREEDIINFLQDPTFIIDNNKIIIAWNRAMEKITGISSVDMIGKGEYAYSFLFNQAKSENLIDIALNFQVMERSEKSDIEYGDGFFISEVDISHYYPGRKRTFWFTACPLYNHQGSVSGAIGSIRDYKSDKNLEISSEISSFTETSK